MTYKGSEDLSCEISTKPLVYDHPDFFSFFNHKNYNFLDFDWSINQYFLKTSNQIVCKGPVCKGIHVVCNQTVLKPNQNGNLNLPITILVSHGCLFDWEGQAGPTNYSQVVSEFRSGTLYSNRIISLKIFLVLLKNCNLYD